VIEEEVELMGIKMIHIENAIIKFYEYNCGQVLINQIYTKKEDR